ncbi:MAG TPA: NADH-quinone oxidoreductase subunit NuoH [Verrucomicrobiae bacterium]|jgi:NADH-quinone oxidoreductase subunit H
MTAIDQIFVTLKHWAVGLFPEPWQPLVSILLSIIPILAVFPGLFAITTVIERKGLGRIQNRLGPNRVGPYGFLQFAADGIKALIKEDVVPRAADKIVHFLAPITLVVPVLLAYSVLPFGRNMVPLDLDAGIVFFFAVGAGTELSLFMAGWSSRNKYALLGAMRAIAQLISYELPLVLCAIPVIMMAQSTSLVGIVAHQDLRPGEWLAHWHVGTPWGLAGFVLFLIAALAESNRSPFDLPEAESEIIAGYFVEYSAFKFALFFLGEYLGLFAVSGLAITMYLGGWTAPVAFLAWMPSWMLFFVKLAALVALFIWIRGTVPRLRADQLMNFAWKFMLPMALLNIAVTGVWFLTNGHWPMPVRWIGCAALLAVPYLLLSRAFEAKVGQRVYRYAN